MTFFGDKKRDGTANEPAIMAGTIPKFEIYKDTEMGPYIVAYPDASIIDNDGMVYSEVFTHVTNPTFILLLLLFSCGREIRFDRAIAEGICGGPVDTAVNANAKW